MQTPQPLFSVITCAYNGAEFLSEAIASLERQKFQNYEHIFVEAFSSDNTLAIIRDYQTRHPERAIRVYQHHTTGISNAMNIGINYAQGQVILFLHCDDYLNSDQVLAKVAEIFGQQNPDILVGNCLFKNGEVYQPAAWSRHWLTRFFLQKMTTSYLFFANGIPHSSTYMKKWVFEKYGGFDETLKAVMDYEMWFRVFNKVKLAFTDEILSVYRYHAATTSNLLADKAKLEIRGIFAKYDREYRWPKLRYYLVMYPFVSANRLLKRLRGPTN